jgi:AcrR family transcriptional regulator
MPPAAEKKGKKSGRKATKFAGVTHPSAPPPVASAPGVAADLTRQRLIRTALELFTTRGYHDTTTAQIAKKAGIAEGTIYRHFSSKQHLANELYRAGQRWATKVVHETVLKPDLPGAKAQLGAIAQALIDGAVREPAVVKIALLEPLTAVLDEESRRTARDFRMAIERVIAEGKAQDVVRRGAVDVWSGVWLAVVTHALAQIAGGTWKPADASARLAVDAAWNAISAS